MSRHVVCRDYRSIPTLDLSSAIGEELFCCHGTQNHHDPFAVAYPVAMCKGTTVASGTLDTCLEGFLQFIMFL